MSECVFRVWGILKLNTSAIFIYGLNILYLCPSLLLYIPAIVRKYSEQLEKTEQITHERVSTVTSSSAWTRRRTYTHTSSSSQFNRLWFFYGLKTSMWYICTKTTDRRSSRNLSEILTSNLTYFDLTWTWYRPDRDQNHFLNLTIAFYE